MPNVQHLDGVVHHPEQYPVNPRSPAVKELAYLFVERV